MNFTREPIILTIITPKDGYRLSVRSCFRGSEEYIVDAVEMISFGNDTFYRSLERTKAFFVPTNSYEVVEVKESGPSLKVREKSKVQDVEKKRKIKRKKEETVTEKKGGDSDDETKKVSSSGGKLLPPPDKLIKESLERFKNEEFFEKNILPEKVEEEDK